ncbi:MAG: hypothetical protein ACO1SV_22865 [Fimbriimonas sp.]
MKLTLGGGSLRGNGTDIDGSFRMDGTYDAEGNVSLIRTYTRTTEPSQLGVGVPYRYEGKWDGTLVSGRWSPIAYAWYGGPFEMWPEHEEERLELAFEVKEETRELVAPVNGG